MGVFSSCMNCGCNFKKDAEVGGGVTDSPLPGRGGLLDVTPERLPRWENRANPVS